METTLKLDKNSVHKTDQCKTSHHKKKKERKEKEKKRKMKEKRKEKEKPPC